jgi:hypothetical protein
MNISSNPNRLETMSGSHNSPITPYYDSSPTGLPSSPPAARTSQPPVSYPTPRSGSYPNSPPAAYFNSAPSCHPEISPALSPPLYPVSSPTLLYRSPPTSPGQDSLYKFQSPSYLDPGVPDPNAAAPPPQHHVVQSLWKEQLIALTMGAITCVLGALGLAACLHRGPLYALFVPLEKFTGRVVNPPNIGALIAGIATAISHFGRQVSSGICKAWLRRRAVRGQAASVKEWKSLAAGVSFCDALTTPFLAGGLMLAFIVAMAFNNSILAGAALPNVRSRTLPSVYGPVVPYLNNGGRDQLVDCTSIAESRSCASWLSSLIS